MTYNLNINLILLAAIIIILIFLATLLVIYFKNLGSLTARVEVLDSVTRDSLFLINNNLDDKINKINQTVDEKLQDNIQKKFQESFNIISDRLENVHKGLGQMQNIANSVIDLQKILANVKTRGTWGEIQLEAILNNILAPSQFIKNAKIKYNTKEIVEFAILLPNDINDNGSVLIPIDSKFPIENYERLLQASENNNTELVNKYSKEIEAFIRKNAKDISEKYISPPQTTDFAIMFLPTESLYAEIIKKPAFVSHIQQQYRVIITGPTTISALISSLQISFRSYALQKNAKEVWKLFAQIKQDFSSHQELIDKAKRKLYETTNIIDNIENRSKILSSKLNKIETI